MIQTNVVSGTDFVKDEEFLRCFNFIERTYLFDDSWIVSSHWLNIPLKEQPTAWTHGRLSGET